jgi:hypothetical protein
MLAVHMIAIIFLKWSPTLYNCSVECRCEFDRITMCECNFLFFVLTLVYFKGLFGAQDRRHDRITVSYHVLI